MADSDSCPWGNLPPELVSRILHFFSPNEIACTCRLINKAIAKRFSCCISVRLSQPVPHHAFVRRWGDERGIHGLTLARRQQLLCLTARSGVIANLEVALAVVGCGLKDEVINAAAEGGHLVVCVWLLDRGCRCNVDTIRCAASAGHTEVVRWALARSPGVAEDALIAAAGAGQRALCEEILPLVLAAGQAWAIRTAACRAAEGGHVELTEWLLGQLPKPARISEGELLRCAARGFELPALQGLYHSRLGSSEASVPAKCIEIHGADIAASALASRTPDWRAKLEWLEAAGCWLVEEQSWGAIAKCGDTVERLTLLRERGLLDARECLSWAVDNANLTVVRYLRSEGLLTGALGGRVVDSAMGVGDLAILAELLGAGGTVGPYGVFVAARHGRLHVLRWLEGPEAGPQAEVVLQVALQYVKLAEYGARSGSLELMEWLWQQDCPSNKKRVFTAAAEAGNAVILERHARGCPMSCDAYLEAGYNGDLATLRCLRRLDCPWGPGCITFDRAVYDVGDQDGSDDDEEEDEEEEDGRIGRCCSLEVLRWLVAEGCPVDWQSARALVLDNREEEADVLAWIESHIPPA